MKAWTRLLFGATALTTVALAAPALAADLDQTVTFSIAPGGLDEALIAYSQQADLQVISASNAVRGKRTSGVEGAATPREALAMLLQDSGLSFVATSPSTVTVTQGEQEAGGSSADATVEALIVTAQKKEENIQDVPIAISAFSAKQLEAQKIEGGFDLLKAIPNVTFTKTNFTSYNFQIRGIGTQAISATTDPGVAVSFNNVALIQNRLFEQEYFDIERVEVLRGPQGTLYGRNATAGVINVISAKPNLGEFDAWIKGEVGNYHTKRLSAMINVPLVEDKLAIRLAGAVTDRQGYDFNTTTGNAVNGRDLWSGRLTVGFQPTDRLHADLIWERFREDDNRSRTGKQLCHRDDGPTEVGGQSLEDLGSFVYSPEEILLIRRAFFSQGCKAGSLYEDAAFGTPNGLSYGFVLGSLIPSEGLFPFVSTDVGRDPVTGDREAIIQFKDPYGGKMQSRNLREISSILDPRYRAQADVVELNIDFDVTDSLTLYSQTAYNNDETFSFQDFNRFNTDPVFTDTSRLVNPTVYREAAPGGIFCDPQLGCSNTIAGFDIAQASATQFSQELRLQSDFEGPVNFSVGANYTTFDVLVDYYVMFNLITAMASVGPFNAPVGSVYSDPNLALSGGDPNAPYDPTTCAWSDVWRGAFAPYGVPNLGPVPTSDPRSPCPYIDPNPIDFSKNFEGDGHNYFRSKNPYKLKSWAAFGELYWNIKDDLKLTAGLRYTDDRKRFVNVPSQVLLAPSYIGGGTVAKGYPEDGVISQKWGEWTGRAVMDWRPDLSFTDETLLYGSFSRGYKGGGANPPRPGFATEDELTQIALDQGTPQFIMDAINGQGIFPVLELTADEYNDTFEPEFVDAFEIGAKNTLLGGAMTLNVTAFYYDYTDYQISQIRDRTAVNENFDAEMWGLELESLFSPSRDLQIVANIGYLDTRVADGETSIDIINRTQGNPDYMLVKPWAQLPSNCVVPTDVVVNNLNTQPFNWISYCGLGGLLGGLAIPPSDPNFGNTRYDSANYPELNGGAGLLADLGGNKLPNAPHWTVNIGGQYTFHLAGQWDLVVRGDAYWQSQSYHRIYNLEPYDKLHGWYNANLSMWAENEDLGLKVEFYVKNLLNKTPITGAFLNSDDTGLTTNVFFLDPRVYGLSLRKEF